jgi:hypothetical protein
MTDGTYSFAAYVHSWHPPSYPLYSLCCSCYLAFHHNPSMFTHASPSLLDAESGENKYDELRKVSDEGVCVCACMWLSLSLRQFMCVAAHDCRSLFLA